MTRIVQTSIAFSALAAMVLQGAPASAKTPNDVADLVGARAAGGESALESRGYHLTHTTTGDDRKWGHWWHASHKQCINVSTYDGRYEAITSTSPGDCNQTANHKNDSGAAIAIGAAALLGAIALSHKSNHHEDNNHFGDMRQEADYERGYRDGLYNHAYSNYDRSNPYSDGYTAGVQQRSHETSYRSGYGNGGGYSANVYLNDLAGLSTSSGTSELYRRGFVIKDVDKSGPGRASTYWRAASRQCVVVYTRNDYVQSVESVRARNCS